MLSNKSHVQIAVERSGESGVVTPTSAGGLACFSKFAASEVGNAPQGFLPAPGAPAGTPTKPIFLSSDFENPETAKLLEKARSAASVARKIEIKQERKRNNGRS